MNNTARPCRRIKKGVETSRIMTLEGSHWDLQSRCMIHDKTIQGGGESGERGEPNSVAEDKRQNQYSPEAVSPHKLRLFRTLDGNQAFVPRVCLVTGAWYPRSAQLTYSSVPVHSFHKHLSLQTYFVIPDR